MHLVKSAHSPLRQTDKNERQLGDDQPPTELRWDTASDAETDALSSEEVDRLNELQKYNTAENTRKNYRSQWAKFEGWCRRKGICALPTTPRVIATYLAGLTNGLSDGKNRKPATLQLAAAAIKHFHKDAKGETLSTAI